MNYSKFSKKELIVKINELSEQLSLLRNIEEEHHKALSTISQNEEKLRIVVSNANAMILILDKNGVITLSEGKLLERFKLLPGQIVGLSVFEIYENEPEVLLDLSKAFKGESIVSVSEVQADFILETIYSPYYDNNGNLSGAIAISTDITERKKLDEEKENLFKELDQSREAMMVDAEKLLNLNDKIIESEEKLRVLNAEKDKFFSIISHDLRSPFAGLMGMTDNLVYYFDKFSTDEIKKNIQLINNTSNRIFKLLENLLQWARLQRGRMEFIPENINLHDIVKSNIELLINNAKQKEILLVNDVNQEIIVFSDNNMLNTILRNLISNAIKFTNNFGSIIISATISTNNFVEIVVKDNGVGMNQDTLIKLFRIDTHHTSVGTANEKGSGLGLILCKELIERNNGTIRVESEQNVGTSFIFTLPLGNINQEKEIIQSDDVGILEGTTAKPAWLNFKEDITEKALTNLPSIILLLENDYLNRRDKISKSQIIREIITFSEELVQFGTENELEIIVNYGKCLLEQCKLFAIDKIGLILNDFDKLIDEIKKNIRNDVLTSLNEN
jgi:PAS domain S-box-containing protein